MKCNICFLFCLMALITVKKVNAQNTFPASGNVGIGTTTPQAKLSFADLFSTAADGITWFSASPASYGIYKTAGAWTGPNYQQLKLSWQTGIILDPGNAFGKSYVDVVGAGLKVTSGTVTVGNVAQPAGYKMYVEQGILTEKVKVAVKTAANWADHVFYKNYRLPTLPQVEQYIRANGHLPGIPSAAEMVKEGNDLLETDARLLAKIEEQSLYIINLHKQVEELQKEMQQMKMQLQKIPVIKKN